MTKPKSATSLERDSVYALGDARRSYKKGRESDRTFEISARGKSLRASQTCRSMSRAALRSRLQVMKSFRDVQRWFWYSS